MSAFLNRAPGGLNQGGAQLRPDSSKPVCRRRLCLLVAWICLTQPLLAGAYFTSGETLKRYCENPDNDACLGYISGAYDGASNAAALNGLQPPFCVPDRVPIGQLARIVAQQLDGSHVPLEHSAAYHVIDALTRAFPCPDDETYL